MRLIIFNGYDHGLVKDASIIEVDEFTVPAIVAAMEKRRWGMPDGRLFVALREDGLGGWIDGPSMLVFRVSVGVKGELLS